MLEVLFWVAVGIVLKTLVPMEIVDTPVKNVWEIIKSKFN